ncbi:MAG TPA: hypothetical protein PKD03_05730 [Ignavibacteriaceae bacterium]|nr:hypothetical protein [Ignavibacteriaceae bacterium]
MKNLFIPFLFAVLFFSLIPNQINAQITFQIGAGAGYSLPSGDYGGTAVDFYNGTKYGMNSGYNFHGKVRLGLLFINAFGEIGYSTFSGDGEIIAGNNNSSVDVKNKILSLRLGPEFKFDIPLSPITPYFDAFLSLNTFSGTVQFKSAPNGLPSDEKNIESASRIGIGGGGGILFSLGGLKLDLNIQYHLMNLAGKKFDGDPTKNQRLESYTFINDDKDPAALLGSTAHIISDSRSINAIEFKLTVLFGI